MRRVDISHIPPPHSRDAILGRFDDSVTDPKVFLLTVAIRLFLFVFNIPPPRETDFIYYRSPSAPTLVPRVVRAIYNAELYRPSIAYFMRKCIAKKAAAVERANTSGWMRREVGVEKESRRVYIFIN